MSFVKKILRMKILVLEKLKQIDYCFYQIFRDCTKLKIVWKKITFFKQRVSII